MRDFKKRPDFYDEKGNFKDDLPYYGVALLVTFSLCWTMFYALEVYSIIKYISGD